MNTPSSHQNIKKKGRITNPYARPLAYTRKDRFRELRKGLISAEIGVYDTPQTMLDQTISVTTNGLKECFTGLLDMKSCGVDMLGAKQPRRSLLGKTRSGLYNRIIYSVDGLLNTGGSLITGSINTVDNLVGNISDLATNTVRLLEGKKSKRTSKFFIRSTIQALTDTLGKEALTNTILKGIAAGKSRYDPLFTWKDQGKGNNTGHFVGRSDRYYRSLTTP